MKKADAQWDLECYTNCPYCDHYFDLTEMNDWYEMLPEPLESNTGQEVEIQCPKCKKDFIVDDFYY